MAESRPRQHRAEDFKMSRITTTKGRERAFLIRTMLRQDSKVGTWHVGITTSRYFWLDLETSVEGRARFIARDYAKRLETDISIYKTNKSFWLVSWKPLTKDAWLGCYNHALSRYRGDVCVAFCECCLRYEKATLRVDRKHGQAIPRRIEVISGLSKRGQPSFTRIPESGEGCRGQDYQDQETKIPRPVEIGEIRTT